MRRFILLLGAGAAVGIACSTGFVDDTRNPGPDLDGGLTSSDAGPCDPRATFRVVTPLSVGTPGTFDGRPSLTANELAVYFERDGTIVSAASASGAFGAPAPVVIGSSPGIAADGGALAFSRAVDGGDLDLFATDLASDPVPLAALNSAAIDRGAAFSADGTRLYFSSARLGPFAVDEDVDSLFVAPAVADGGFAGPVAMQDATTSNGLALGYDPTPSADGTTMYFARRSSAGTDHVYVADLSADGTTLANPTAVAAIDATVFGDATTNQFPGFISADQCRLYFSSDTGGPSRLYVASRR